MYYYQHYSRSYSHYLLLQTMFLILSTPPLSQVKVTQRKNERKRVFTIIDDSHSSNCVWLAYSIIYAIFCYLTASFCWKIYFNTIRSNNFEWPILQPYEGRMECSADRNRNVTFAFKVNRIKSHVEHEYSNSFVWHPPPTKTYECSYIGQGAQTAAFMLHLRTHTLTHYSFRLCVSCVSECTVRSPIWWRHYK